MSDAELPIPEALRHWLLRRSAEKRTIVSSERWERDPTARQTQDHSLPGQVVLTPLGGTVYKGGQAAVGQVRLDLPFEYPARELALRIEIPEHGERLRRDVILENAWRSRNQRERFPALVHIEHSFTLHIQSNDLYPDTYGKYRPAYYAWADVMAWGTSLRNHVRQTGRYFDAEEAALLLLPVFETIARLHDEGDIIHQDLDANNVLLMEDGTLAVTDWGSVIALRAQKDVTIRARADGKRDQYPPDSEHGLRVLGKFTDVWLLGRLLFWMITGQKQPYTAWHDYHRLPSYEFHPEVRDLPGPLADLVRGMCHDDHAAGRISLAEATELLRDYCNRKGRGADVDAEVTLSLRAAVDGGLTSIPVENGHQVVRLPRGVCDGQILRFEGLGLPGSVGSPAGDLVLTVKVNVDPEFSRDGNNLGVVLRVSAEDASAGAVATVTTFDGSAVRIRVPAGSATGTRLRVRGEGIETEDERGDLLVTLKVLPATHVGESRKYLAGNSATAPERSGPAADDRPPTPARPQPPDSDLRVAAVPGEDAETSADPRLPRWGLLAAVGVVVALVWSGTSLGYLQWSSFDGTEERAAPTGLTESQSAPEVSTDPVADAAGASPVDTPDAALVPLVGGIDFSSVTASDNEAEWAELEGMRTLRVNVFSLSNYTDRDLSFSSTCATVATANDGQVEPGAYLAMGPFDPGVTSQTDVTSRYRSHRDPWVSHLDDGTQMWLLPVACYAVDPAERNVATETFATNWRSVTVPASGSVDVPADQSQLEFAVAPEALEDPRVEDFSIRGLLFISDDRSAGFSFGFTPDP